MSDWVLLARVRRARGIRGEVTVETFGSQPDRFDTGLKLSVFQPGAAKDGAQVEIERAWLHNGELVLKLDGVDTRNDAEALRGAELRIPVEERPPAPEGEYYLSDLIGCRVERPDGEPIGEVIAWQDYGAAPLLEVRRGDRQFFVPFAAAFYRTVDVDGKRIVMELPEGLEDLDAR